MALRRDHRSGWNSNPSARTPPNRHRIPVPLTARRARGTPNGIRTRATAVKEQSRRRRTSTKTGERPGQRALPRLALVGCRRPVLTLVLPQRCPAGSVEIPIATALTCRGPAVVSWRGCTPPGRPRHDDPERQLPALAWSGLVVIPRPRPLPPRRIPALPPSDGHPLLGDQP